MKTIRYELADGIATLTLDEPDSPVNTMCVQWQHDLTEAVQQVVKDKDALRGVASLCIGGGEATAMAVERIH